MFKILSMTLNSTAFATTLALAATVFHPSKTLALPSAQTDANSQAGCLSGYPNGTYQGSRPVTRNEFAAGLNACLNQVNQLIPALRPNLATKADFDVLIQRQIELNRQLREISNRVGDSPAENPSKR